MFCPNCGTQNSETASTCTKCGFNLKGAAAPKFKGTMLMSQQPAPAAPARPGAPPGPPGPPQGPPAGPPQGLAGTVVGVAPAGLGRGAGPPPAPPPPGGYGGPPQGGPAFGGAAAGPPQQGGFGAQQPQGVNPLGGTMAIDSMPAYSPPAGPPLGQGPAGFGGGQPGGFPAPTGGPPGGGFGAPPGGQQPGFGGPPGGDPYGGGQGGFGGPPQGGPPQGGFGGPPQDQGFGGGGFGPPPGQPGAYGGPPQGGQPGGYGGQPQGGFGGPPQDQGGYGGQQPGGFGSVPPQDPYAQQQQQGGFGGAPPGYGAPQQGYGQQQQQAPGGYGAPGGGYGGQQAGAMMQGAMQGAMGGFADLNNPNARPKVRNAFMTCAVPLGLMIGGNIIGTILAMVVDVLFYVGQIISLAGVALAIVYAWNMLKELKNATNDSTFQPWFIFIPCLNYYFMWIKVPQQMTKAKQMARSQQPTRGIIVYFFVFLYALAADLNDLANPQN